VKRKLVEKRILTDLFIIVVYPIIISLIGQLYVTIPDDARSSPSSVFVSLDLADASWIMEFYNDLWRGPFQTLSF